MRVYADELALLLNVGDDIVYRYLGSGAGGRRSGDDVDALVLRVDRALKRADVSVLGVVDDYTDSLRGVHDRTAADRDQVVSAGALELSDAVLYIFDCRICLDIVKNFVCETGFFKHLGYFCGDAEFYKILVGDEQRFLKAALLRFERDVFTRAPRRGKRFRLILFCLPFYIIPSNCSSIYVECLRASPRGSVYSLT